MQQLGLHGQGAQSTWVRRHTQPQAPALLPTQSCCIHQQLGSLASSSSSSRATGQQWRPHALQSHAATLLHGRPCRRRVACGLSASAFAQDPADVIPDAYDDEDDDPDRTPPAKTPALVVGAGPIGLITAMYLARRGYPVQVFDKLPPPGYRSDEQDYPLVLSARALLAFEELGATELLSSLTATPMKGRWWMSGAHDSSAATMAGTAKGAAVLETFPGHDQRYTRRVLVSRKQLEQALLKEAGRLFPDKIKMLYHWEFKRINWDMKQILVTCTHPSTGSEAVKQQDSTAQPVDQLLPELQASATQDDVWVEYGLLVGADGADSAVREALRSKKPKITDFDVQRPMWDTRQFKSFTGLPQVPPSGEAVPAMSAHKPGEYEYVYQAEGAPALRLWLSAPGQISGTIAHLGSWDASSLDSALQQAYGSRLPEAWRQSILQQVCGPQSPSAWSYANTVQCSQFHGPRVALVGDAAHAMTGEYDQGINCGVEGVRLLNIALKSANDNIDKSLNIYSEVRGEDVHSMQQLEFFKRSTAPGLKYADAIHSVAGWIGGLVWRAALMMMALVRMWLPNKFPRSYVPDRIWDARRGYSDLLKVVVRFGAVPFLAVLAVVVLVARLALAPRFGL